MSALVTDVACSSARRRRVRPRLLLPHGSQSGGFGVFHVSRGARAVRGVHRGDVVARVPVLRRPRRGQPHRDQPPAAGRHVRRLSRFHSKTSAPYLRIQWLSVSIRGAMLASEMDSQTFLFDVNDFEGARVQMLVGGQTYLNTFALDPRNVRRCRGARRDIRRAGARVLGEASPEVRHAAELRLSNVAELCVCFQRAFASSASVLFREQARTKS